MINFKLVAKLWKIVLNVLKYSVLFWKVLVNLTCNENNRVNTAEVLRAGDFSRLVAFAVEQCFSL
jgi:hypothetical protein